MSSQVLALREILEQRFPGAAPVRYGTAEVVATGIEALDRVLPGGGLPRGRLTAWMPGGGATAALRAACVEVVRRGERVGWVESREWGSSSIARETRLVRGLVLLRPDGRTPALACTEELLRSGGFGLVVLVGVSAVGEEAVRLARAAREGGSAFVALSEDVPVAAMRLASSIAPEGYRWRPGPFGEPAEVESVTLAVHASALGWSVRAEFSLPVGQHELRLSLDPGRLDRRGAAL